MFEAFRRGRHNFILRFHQTNLRSIFFSTKNYFFSPLWDIEQKCLAFRKVFFSAGLSKHHSTGPGKHFRNTRCSGNEKFFHIFFGLTKVFRQDSQDRILRFHRNKLRDFFFKKSVFFNQFVILSKMLSAFCPLINGKVVRTAFYVFM